MTRIAIACLLACALALAGCGGHSKQPPRSSRQSQLVAPPILPAACVPGNSAMGCSITGSTSSRPALAPIAGPEFPDVSIWQGLVDWNAVAAWQRAHGWATGGAFKLGEFVQDPTAAWNAAHTRGLSWRAGYWFVRNTGCAHEAGQIAAVARALGLRLVVLDIEVPEAAGYSTCLVPALRAGGFAVAIYTGSGTWPGGNPQGAPLWDATYGPTPFLRGLWTSRLAAWQFTDGRFGNATFIPGLGFVDVDVDLGLSRLAGAQPKPKPRPARVHCFGRHYSPARHARVCDELRPRVSNWSHNRDHAKRLLAWAHGILKGYRCRRPYRRAVCMATGEIARQQARWERVFAARVRLALRRWG